ncbi:hypothetical protein [Bacillus cereus]|uniref:hypothetical protein n=1 Tax=Bacillus cereus TaxID=1396 RepID=UPI000BFB6DE0|nr:hypothetical protein [Bacillus cereus]PGQ13807.1 hypothetical protein COA09_12605 [Bacillus cereus]PGS55974.1 hypothetical protein COC67_20940 [Bacillus cereus]PGU89991.1 hypothetical protein COD77_30825 [Bacillus cereus]
MNNQLKVQTSYLVMVGNLFIRNHTPLMMSRNTNGAMEFEHAMAKRIAQEINGVVVRKTVEYEMVINR